MRLGPGGTFIQGNHRRAPVQTSNCSKIPKNPPFAAWHTNVSYRGTAFSHTGLRLRRNAMTAVHHLSALQHFLCQRQLTGLKRLRGETAVIVPLTMCRP